MGSSRLLIIACVVPILAGIGELRSLTAVDTIEAVEAIVVRPRAWSGAIQTWKQHRAQQGMQILELDSSNSPQEISAKLSELNAKHRKTLKFIILAGDVSAPSSIPTFYKKSTAMVQFGGDKTIATDNPYGDFDDDGIPDVAVGRIPADSPKQLQQYLDRVIAYENDPDLSRWRRDLHVVAGVGGFGALADSAIEMTTRRFLAERIPGWSELSMTQASVSSHYCPDPWRFSETCVARMNQGWNVLGLHRPWSCEDTRLCSCKQ